MDAASPSEEPDGVCRMCMFRLRSNVSSWRVNVGSWAYSWMHVPEISWIEARRASSKASCLSRRVWPFVTTRLPSPRERMRVMGVGAVFIIACSRVVMVCESWDVAYSVLYSSSCSERPWMLRFAVLFLLLGLARNGNRGSALSEVACGMAR